MVTPPFRVLVDVVIPEHYFSLGQCILRQQSQPNRYIASRTPKTATTGEQM